MLRLLIIMAIFFSTKSFALEFQGKFIQGHFIIGKTEPGSSIFVDKKKIKVSKDGYFAFGIEKDRKFDIVITENDKKIIKKIKKRKYNIRVNTVAPTFVATPMVKKFFKNKEFKKLALGNIPMGKLATESDVATSVCFLASSASSMVTATSILVDGGWTAK